MKNKNGKRPDPIKNDLRPWLDPDGNLYSTEALKELSKGWDKKLWDKFLSCTVDSSTQEKIPSPHVYHEACEKNFETIFEQFVGEKREAPKDIQRLIKEVVRHLTNQQVRILKEIYWENRSLREVARMLQIDGKQVRVQHARSLSKLKDLLISRTPNYTYSEGQRRFLAEFFTPIDGPQNRDEQIREVYREDCQMRFFKS